MKKGGLAAIFSPMAKLAEGFGGVEDRLDMIYAKVCDQLTVQEKIVSQLELQTSILKSIEGGKKMGNKTIVIGEAGGAEIADIIRAVGEAAAQAGQADGGKIRESLTALTDGIGPLLDQAKEGVGLIKEVGQNLVSLGWSMLKFGMLAILAAPFLLLSIPVLALLGFTFATIGKFEKSIQKGSDVIGGMGDALKDFALGVAMYGITIALIALNPALVLGMAAVLVVISGAVALVGLMAKPIRKGNMVLAGMGLGLAVFGLGYAVFAWAVGSPSWEDIGKQAVIVGGLGLVVGLLGLAASYVLMGSLAVAGMGAAMWLFSLGYSPFAEATKGRTWNDVGIQLGIIGGLGVEFGLLGLGAILIIPGAAAVAAIGGALWALSEGLIAYKKVDWEEQDSKDLATVLTGLKGAFMGGQENAGFFSKLGGMFTGVMDAVIILEAAAGFAAIGATLVKLSEGLKAFKTVDWDEEDTMYLTGVLGGLSSAFTAAGGEPQNPGGVMGFVFGNTFSPNAVERGIDSVMDAGDALIEITKGLKAFWSMIEDGVEFGDPENPEEGTLSFAAINAVGTVRKAFAAVGREGDAEDTGFWGWLGFKENVVAKGIDAVKGAGKELTQISKGLIEFWNMIEDGVEFGDPENPEDGTLAYAVINAIGTVRKAFAAVGREGDEEDTGFWGWLGFKENVVAKGIDAVKGAGKELKNIALGLMEFQKMIADNVVFGDPDNPTEGTIAYSVINAIGTVRKAFAAVGREGDVEDTGFWGWLGFKENVVKKGVDAVKGAGKELKDIAIGLAEFQKLITDGVKFGDPEDPKPDTLAYGVIRTLGFVRKAFAAIGGETEEREWGGWFSYSENLVEAGVKAVKGAGTELSNIAKGLKEFSDLVYGDKDIDFEPDGKLAQAVGKSMTFIGSAFAAIGRMNAGERPASDDFWANLFWSPGSYIEDGVDAVKGAGKELTQIGEGLKVFVDMITGEVDFNTLEKIVGKVLTFVSTNFAAIGGSEAAFRELPGLQWHGEGYVQKGIKTVQGADAALKGIAEGVKAYADLKNPQAIANAINDLFNATTLTFANAAKKPAWLSALNPVHKFWNDMAKHGTGSGLEKAAKDMGVMAKNISKLELDKMEGLADMMGTFAAANNSMDAGFMNDVSSGISKMAEGFNNYFGGGGEDSDSPETTADSSNPGKPSSPKRSESAKIARTLSQINKTLKQLQTTMSGLPDDISQIKLKT